MESIEIFKTTPDDLDTLAQISRKIFYDAFHALNKPENMQEYMDRAFAPAQLLTELHNPLSEFYFIHVDHAIAGYLKLNQKNAQSDIGDDTSLEIERIYIDALYQGRGLGAKLIEKAKERARELGLQFIWLGVWEKNTDAIRFYERYGFHVFGSHAFKMGDEMQTDILMKYTV